MVKESPSWWLKRNTGRALKYSMDTWRHYKKIHSMIKQESPKQHSLLMLLFNTFPPDHRKTTVNITKRKKVKWRRKHVDQPLVMRKIPQQVIGASLEEMVQRVLSRPEIILQLWLNKTSEKVDSNRLRCSHQGRWTTKIKMETCSSETTDGMQRRWKESAVLRATTKKSTHTTLRRKVQRLCPLEENAVGTATEKGSSKQRDEITLL